MHLNPWCKAALLSGDMVQSPSPSVSSLTAPGTSRLQFTVPPSMYWVINYAVLPRMGTQTQRQAIKRHSASPRASHALPSLCLSPALLHQADTADTCFLHLQLHSGKMPPHFGLVRPPPTPPRLIAGSRPSLVPAAGAVVTLAARTTSGHRAGSSLPVPGPWRPLYPSHPGSSAVSPSCSREGPRPESRAGPSSARRRPRLGVPVRPGEADAGAPQEQLR